MIEDKELRDLFKIESDEQLQRLDRGLLELEKHPENRTLIEEMFREIHSLKGGVRMLLLADMEGIAHRFESVLGAAKKGTVRLTSEVFDRLYRSLDALRKMAGEAVTGEPAGVVVADVIADLSLIAMGERETRTDIAPERPSPASSEPAAGEPDIEASPGEAAPEAQVPPPVPEALGGQVRTPPSEAPQGSGTEGEFRIETIRVSTDKLDALMTLLGELGVTKNRLAHRLVMIDEAVSVWEKLNNLSAEHHLLLSDTGRGSGDGSSNRLLEHHARERERVERLGTLLNDVRIAANEDSSKLDLIVGELEDGVRSIRLLPLATVFDLFPRMVRDLARAQGKEAGLVVQGGETTADKRVIEDIKDPLMHMIRNAIDHGIEPPEERERLGKPKQGTIELKAYKTASNIFIEVRDDGRGLDNRTIRNTALKRKLAGEAELDAMTPAEIRSLVFISGFSTSPFISDVSGRGVGLDVVRANVERLKGIVQVESTPGSGCTFRVQLPITMAAARVLTVAVAGHKYALLVEYVESIHLIPEREIFTVEGHSTLVLDGRPLSVSKLAGLLELEQAAPKEDGNGAKGAAASPVIPCVVVNVGEDRIGLLVDELVDEQEVVLKQQSRFLKRLRNISGATILGTGEVCLVLNPQDLLKSARKGELPARPRVPQEEAERAKLILMAEDTLTTRTQMKRILEAAGYEVVTAVDGLDAFTKIAARPFDALVTDIMMPNMDGLTLTEKLRENPKYKELPIILVTTLSSDEDRKRGLDVGASAYITKPAFDQKVLLDTLRRLT